MVQSGCIFEPDVFEKLTKRLGRRIASLDRFGPKNIKWSFLENKKTEIIDILRHALKKRFRFLMSGKEKKMKIIFATCASSDPAALGGYSGCRAGTDKENGK